MVWTVYTATQHTKRMVVVVNAIGFFYLCLFIFKWKRKRIIIFLTVWLNRLPIMNEYIKRSSSSSHRHHCRSSCECVSPVTESSSITSVCEWLCRYKRWIIYNNEVKSLWIYFTIESSSSSIARLYTYLYMMWRSEDKNVRGREWENKFNWTLSYFYSSLSYISLYICHMYSYKNHHEWWWRWNECYISVWDSTTLNKHTYTYTHLYTLKHTQKFRLKLTNQ